MLVSPDSFKGMLKGTMRGLGIQKYAVYLNLIGYWILCLPIQTYFCLYLNMRLPGLWIGKLFFEILIAFVFYLVIYLVDWQNIIDETQERI